MSKIRAFVLLSPSQLELLASAPSGDRDAARTALDVLQQSLCRSRHPLVREAMERRTERIRATMRRKMREDIRAPGA